MAISSPKIRPWPLSQVSRTGLPGASVVWSAVHSVSACGVLIDGVGRRPAELGVVGMLAADRRQHRHRVALGVDGLAIFDQPHVVDAAAFQRDRADQLGRVEGDARRGGQRLLAAQDLSRGRLGRRRARRPRRRRLAGRRLRRCGLARRLRRRDRRLGRLEEMLPAHDDQHREHDSDDEILLVHFGRTLLRLRRARRGGRKAVGEGWRRRQAPDRSRGHPTVRSGTGDAPPASCP